MANQQQSSSSSSSSSELQQHEDEEQDQESPLELILFHVSECYVYLIPPRKSAASYRADEWNVNKWAWEGCLKVVSKGEQCIIRLEDKQSGELYAQAFLREGHPHPVEAVIDSSRYFVLRVEETIGGHQRHAFIGLGFRERTEAYDFQAALHDHLKYLDKKKTAEEMEQHFLTNSSVDYSLKEGETIVLQLKTKGTRGSKSTFFEQGLNNLSLEEKSESPKKSSLCLKPPPPPSSTVSPVQSPASTGEEPEFQKLYSHENKHTADSVEDDFGDFQAAG